MSMSCLQAALRAGMYALHDVDWRTIRNWGIRKEKAKKNKKNNTREDGQKKKSNKRIQQTTRNAQNQLLQLPPGKS